MNRHGEFKKYILRDLKEEFNLFAYFSRNYVWAFDFDEMDECIVQVHEGDLDITSMQELPSEMDVLIVKGDLTVHSELRILEYGATDPEGNLPQPGAMIVTGNLECSELYLSSGDIVIMKDLLVHKFIYSEEPAYEQGSLHVKGVVEVPYIFIANRDNPSYYFEKNPERMRDEETVKYVKNDSEETAIYIEGILTTADLYWLRTTGKEA